MALIFCCGGECGVSGTGSHWPSVAGLTFSTATKRSGDRSMRLNPSVANAYASPSLPGGGGTIAVARVYVHFASLPTTDAMIFNVRGGVATGVGIGFKSSDSKLYTYNMASVAFGTTGVAVTTGVWYRLDLRVNIAANPWVVDAEVDGSALGPTNFAIAGTTGPHVSIGNNPGASATETYDAFFDDLAISATSGDYPIGAGYVNHFVPTTDGTHNIAGTGDFQRGTTAVDILNATTTAYQLVDDVPLPSSVTAGDSIAGIAPANPTTDYVECVFGPATGVSTPTTGPRVVDVVLAHHQAATQAGQMQVLLNDNGTTSSVFDTGSAAGVTTLRYARAAYSDPPSAATVWHANNDGSNGDFRDLRFRFLAQDAAPDQFLDAIMIEAEFAEVSAGHTLTADAGSFSVTGNAATALRNRLTTADAGSFSMVGNAANALKGVTAVADSGAFSTIGNDAAIKRDYRPIADAGAFSVNGNNANAVRTYIAIADAGAFPYTGNAAQLFKGYALTADNGSFLVTGNAANLLRGYRVAADSGIFSYTGNAAAAIKNNLLSASAGSFSISGNLANLVRGYQLLADSGTFGVAGSTANLIRAFRALADAGVFAYAGNDANAVKTHILVAASGSFLVVGNAASAVRAHRLTADTAAFSVTGNAANLLRGLLAIADAAAFSVNGNNATAFVTAAGSHTLIAVSGTFSTVGNNANIARAYRTTADGGAFAHSGNDAFASKSHNLSANAGNFACTGNPANIVRAYAAFADAGEFGYTGASAEVLRQYRLLAEAGVFDVIGYNVNVVLGVAFPGAVPPLSYTLFSGRNGIALIATQNEIALTSGRHKTLMTVNAGELALDPGTARLDLEDEE